MKKEELVALGLSEEQAEKVAEASTEELKTFIPKHRFDEVNEAKKAAEKTVSERDEQLKTLGESAGQDADLKKQIEDLQSQNETAKTQYEADLRALMIEHIVERELSAVGAKDVAKAKRLLELSEAKLDESGENVVGLKDQIKTLTTDEITAGMFGAETKPNPKGLKPGEGSDGNPSKTPNQPSTLKEAVESHYKV